MFPFSSCPQHLRTNMGHRMDNRLRKEGIWIEIMLLITIEFILCYVCIHVMVVYFGVVATYMTVY